MPAPEFIRPIRDAESAQDPEKTALSMGVARWETDNVARTLRHRPARKRPAHRRSNKAAA